MSRLRIASYNVENLFDRAKALNWQNPGTGEKVLRPHAELSQLLEHDPYTAADKKRILELLEELGLLRSDESTYVLLRKIRGRLLKRPRSGPVEVVANGRSDWIGWVELVTEHVDEEATQHTAMVIDEVGAQILGVVEAEARPVLEMFSAAMLEKVGSVPYEQVMLIDGNDKRGIDVGLLARGDYPIHSIRSHIFDEDAKGKVFSRDCCEYHLTTPGGETLVVMVNHFKSKGYGDKSDPIGAKRRERQAEQVAKIYEGLVDEGIDHIAVLGDLNDDPSSTSLRPLLEGTKLQDISEHPNFDFGTRKGTFGSGNEKDKIDYVLLSPSLFGRATGGGVFRKGVWRGSRTKDPWDIFPTMTEEKHQASDHAAIYADLEMP